MRVGSPSREAVSFGPFQANLETGELRCGDLPIKLPKQSFQVLAALLERPGGLVTRDELRHRLWPDGTFVDYDHSLNAAVNRLREALDDSAATPHFVETLPGRGYRFIGPVERMAHPVVVGELPPVARGRWRAWMLAAGGVAVLMAIVLALNLGGLRERLRGRPAVGEIKSLAVLPLRNLSGDPEQEYFADGMTEALITELGRISNLRVISRTSVMQYKETAKPLPTIARELNVDAIVEGSAVQEGGRVRVTAQLIRASPEQHLWSESYERELVSVLALQREIARDIAGEIQVTLNPQEAQQLSGGQELNPEAYQTYLQGLYYLHGSDPPSWLRASGYFERAVAKEPEWAMAHAMLGRAYHWYASAGHKEYWEKSKQALLRALALDDTLAEAHAALGYVLHNYDWDWAGAEKEYRRALELNPSEAHGYALFLMFLGRSEEAITLIRRAERADPLHLALKVNVGRVYNCAGQPDKAIEQLQSVLELKSDYSYAYESLFSAYLRKSAYPEALAALEKAREFGEGETGYKVNLAYAYARMGRRQEAVAMVRELRDASPVDSALIYATLGDTDRALTLLERAYRERDGNLLYIRCWPVYEQLRTQPRLQALLRRMNFPE